MLASQPSEISDSGLNCAADVKASKRKSWQRYTPGKLHNRVMTEEEKEEDRSCRVNSDIHNLPEQDVFGTLQHSQAKPSGKKRVIQKLSGTVEESKPKFIFSQSNIPPSIETGTAEERDKSSFVPDAEQIHQSYDTKLRQKSARGHRRVDRFADSFGALQQNDLKDRIQESLSTAVGSHEERLSGREYEADEDPSDRSHIRLSSVNRRHIPDWYGRKITRLNKRGKVREAIEVLEDWMLKRDRVMPNAYVFTSLITGLGHAGYTKKAFHLFNKMKKMGITPKPQTYTALFNACANSPWPHDGLARADNLYRLMQEKGIQPAFITGKAMIKAFARCGDVRQAFFLMDQLSQRHRPDAETFSSLLMACVEDRKAGLCHAIQVWRLMQKLKIQPDLPLYNLLIRCVRDCGVGDATTLADLLGGTVSNETLTSGRNTASKQVLSDGKLQGFQSGKNVLPLEEQHDQVIDCTGRHEDKQTLELHPLEQQSVGDAVYSPHTKHGKRTSLGPLQRYSPKGSQLSHTTPDVLSPSCDISQVISLGDMSSKESQLALVGGAEGILGRMVKDGVQPNIITFSQFITVCEPAVEAEEHLLRIMEKMKVKPDIDLLNALIHKRCMRRDFIAARGVQQMISDYKLAANLRTFGVLAMSCQSQPEGEQLLQDMEVAELQPNMEILGTLVYAARTNFAYMLWVLREVQKLDLLPNTKFLQNVESALAHTRKMIVQAESKREVDSYFMTPRFQERHEHFVQHYERWLQQTGVHVPAHPWASFRPKQDDKEMVMTKTV